MRKIIFVFSLFTIHYSLVAQVPSNEIYMGLKKLKVLGSVLYIAAHPDDENNSLLPYFAKEKLYRTAYLSLTRGDGGQNLIGSEQGIELGLIRTQELLAARRIDGSEQYFTSAYEFGFSKNANETFSIWNHEKVLADAVWVIRKFQPDVIIARFPPDKRAGHGHHSASAIIAEEAFIAAADSNKFKEQFKYGVQTWQAKRLVWNTFNFGGNNTTNDNQLKIDIGNYNTLLGKSYGEIGGEARTMHKSQGEGRPRRKGSIFEYFTLIAGDTMKTDLMEGVKTNWNEIALEYQIEDSIDKIIKQFNFQQPELSIKGLVNLYKYLQSAKKESRWFWQKISEVQQLIIQCAGLHMEAVTDNEYAVKGQKLNLNFLINSRLANNIQLQNISVSSNYKSVIDTTIDVVLSPNKNITFTKTIEVENNKKVSQPYWLEAPMVEGSMFTVTDQTVTGNADNEAPYMAKFVFSIDNISFTYKYPLQYKYVDATLGEVLQPVVVIPAITVALSPDVVLTNVSGKNKKDKNYTAQIQFKSNYTQTNAAVQLICKQGETTVYSTDTIINLETAKIYSFDLPVHKFFNAKKDKNLGVAIVVNNGDGAKQYEHHLKQISYNHIPNLNYFYKDNVKLVTEPITTIAAKVGYIIGAGDKVPEALTQLGVTLTYLFEKDITLENLQQFDAIITGIRAPNIYEWLTNKNDILNAYVNNGGNLIVQYLKSNTVNNKKIKIGPYAFSINAQSRVTEEAAAVNFLLPQHSVLNYPNTITNKDFDGWVQERSTYQAEKMDANFESILSMHDTNEPPSNGSLVIAKYGKGNFAYVSLVLFRQLPAGLPGAYKLLANLIALPKNK